MTSLYKKVSRTQAIINITTLVVVLSLLIIPQAFPYKIQVQFESGYMSWNERDTLLKDAKDKGYTVETHETYGITVVTIAEVPRKFGAKQVALRKLQESALELEKNGWKVKELWYDKANFVINARPLPSSLISAI